MRGAPTTGANAGLYGTSAPHTDTTLLSTDPQKLGRRPRRPPTRPSPFPIQEKHRSLLRKSKHLVSVGHASSMRSSGSSMRILHRTKAPSSLLPQCCKRPMLRKKKRQSVRTRPPLTSPRQHRRPNNEDTTTTDTTLPASTSNFAPEPASIAAMAPFSLPGTFFPDVASDGTEVQPFAGTPLTHGDNLVPHHLTTTNVPLRAITLRSCSPASSPPIATTFSTTNRRGWLFNYLP